MKRSVLFVINPISGGKSKKHLPNIFHRLVDSSRFDISIFWWDEVSTLESEVTSFVDQNGYMVVAVGGDGTVNLIAKYLIHKSTMLAILPLGSGNGLARQTGFKQSIESFLSNLNHHQSDEFVQIDIGQINGKSFVNMAGLGFDAHITTVFSEMKERGFLSYAKAVVKHFNRYPNRIFKISYGTKSIVKEAFMVNVANGTQWGNDFFIAPKALLNDGKLDLIVVKKPTYLQLIPFLIALRTGKSHPCVSYQKSENFRITTETPIPLHLDGEPSGNVSNSEFTILPKSIKLMKMI